MARKAAKRADAEATASKEAERAAQDRKRQEIEHEVIETEDSKEGCGITPLASAGTVNLHDHIDMPAGGRRAFNMSPKPTGTVSSRIPLSKRATPAKETTACALGGHNIPEINVDNEYCQLDCDASDMSNILQKVSNILELLKLLLDKSAVLKELNIVCFYLVYTHV